VRSACTARQAKFVAFAGTSRRTLVLRLAKTGSPFRPLLDGTLRERARTMLRGGHTIAVDGGIVCANPGIKGGGWDS
jgi:hypothetical protein